MANKLTQIQEAAKAGALHPKHVHAYSTGKNEFTIHSVGAKAHSGIKKGMKVTSGDLDDFREMGHKVKEIKKPAGA
jgi:hypothetical protein